MESIEITGKVVEVDGKKSIAILERQEKFDNRNIVIPMMADELIAIGGLFLQKVTITISPANIHETDITEALRSFQEPQE